MQNLDKHALINNIRLAMEAVKTAQRSARDAGMVETLDLFSSNKLLSLWSSAENYSMKQDLTNMQHALSKVKLQLTDLTGRNAFTIELVDLASDLFLEWNTDWISLFNLHKIYDIHTKCQTIYTTLEKLLSMVEKEVAR